MKRYKSQIWLDVDDHIKHMQIHAFSLGYDDNIYLLVTSQHIDRRNGMTAKIDADYPMDYRVLKITKQQKHHHLQNTRTNHALQSYSTTS